MKEWQEQAAFIIGGGSSLRDFDFSVLSGLNTIGVNDAFRLGPDISKICLFGDGSWWNTRHRELRAYVANGGRVYSISPTVEPYNIPYLHKLARVNHGFTMKENFLAWNYSTGAAAVNLAVQLGAERIYLLGFDMTKVQGKSHWHDHHRKVTSDDSFARFLEGFQNLSTALHKFPEIQVFNVGDGTSKLNVFPKITFEEMKERITNGTA